jgi:hypothetical protein
MDSTTTTDVKPGQTWADTRNPGRTLRIDTISNGKATCTVTANSTEVQAYLDQVHGAPAPAGKYYGDKRSTTTRIAVTTLARKEWQLTHDARTPPSSTVR